MNNNYDIIMVGGGVMGCATAYNLLKLEPQLRIAIIEMDTNYTYSSTVLSDGNHRIQFNLKENIQISQYGLVVLATFAEAMTVDDVAPQIDFRQEGNLFLVNQANRTEAEAGLAQQQRLGCRTAWLNPTEISAHYPLLTSGDYVGATFGPDDGTMNPYGVLQAYKNKAMALGAQVIPAKVTKIRHQANRVTGVTLASGEKISSKFVLNSAGAWASPIIKTAGVDLPVQPIKRQVFVVETTARPEKILPGLFFPSGLYCFHEGQGVFMCGKSLPDDPIGYEFDWDRAFFEEYLWPELVDYMPVFDRLKILRGWAGLYAVNTFDDNAILGEWPELRGFYLANGFSGHGFQQCHAVGRYIAELMLNLPPTLDLSIFSPQRLLDNRPVFESKHRIV